MVVVETCTHKAPSGAAENYSGKVVVEKEKVEEVNCSGMVVVVMVKEEVVNCKHTEEVESCKCKDRQRQILHCLKEAVRQVLRPFEAKDDPLEGRHPFCSWVARKTQ